MKDYANLLTVDVVCHGVPSAKVYNKHLTEIAEDTGEAVTQVKFRDKADGWKRGKTLFLTENHCMGSSKRRETYMRLFLNNVSIRPSCADCAFNNKRSLADITIALPIIGALTNNFRNLMMTKALHWCLLIQPKDSIFSIV